MTIQDVVKALGTKKAKPAHMDVVAALQKQPLPTKPSPALNDLQQYIPGGMDYTQRRDFERQQEALFEKTNPGAALVADIGGAVVAPVVALGKGAGMLSRMAASSAATGVMGGTYGFMEGEDGGRTEDGENAAIVSAFVGSAIPVAGAGIQKVANSRAFKKGLKKVAANAPTTDQLRASGNAAYKAIDDRGVAINPDAFKAHTSGVIDDMMAGGLDDVRGGLSLRPKSARIAQLLEEASEGKNAIPFSAVDQLRRKAAIPAGDIGNKVEQRLGANVTNGLDDFINNAGDDAVAYGKAAGLGDDIAEARRIWSKMSKSQAVDDAIEGQRGICPARAAAFVTDSRKPSTIRKSRAVILRLKRKKCAG